MTREVVIVAKCDWGDCGTRASSHTATVDDLGPLEFDVCEVHAKESGLDDLLAFLGAFGRAPSTAKRAPARPRPRQTRPDRLCPFCPDTFPEGSKAWAAHLAEVHSFNALDMRRCPLDGRDFHTIQALAMHSARAHGMAWEVIYREARSGDIDQRNNMRHVDRSLSNVKVKG